MNLGSHPLFSDVKAFVARYGLIGVFLATILAGTVVPVGSLALVVAAASIGVHPFPLVIVATAGFTIGMVINYGLAYGLGRPYVLKKVGVEKLEEISAVWSRWGWIIYTIFWLIPVLPVEFLSLFCGLIKTRFSIFLILSFVPRLIVFTLLAYFGSQFGM
jgi:membrane protein YqaA with SNARE-associated domain